MVTAMFGLGPLNPQNKGGSQYSKDVTRTQQQRPESPMATLTWHASKYKVHQLTERKDTSLSFAVLYRAVSCFLARISFHLQRVNRKTGRIRVSGAKHNSEE